MQWCKQWKSADSELIEPSNRKHNECGKPYVALFEKHHKQCLFSSVNQPTGFSSTLWVRCRSSWGTFAPPPADSPSSSPWRSRRRSSGRPRAPSSSTASASRTSWCACPETGRMGTFYTVILLTMNIIEPSNSWSRRYVQGLAKRWSPGCVNAACKARQKW